MTKESDLDFRADQQPALGSGSPGFYFPVPSSWSFSNSQSYSKSIYGFGVTAAANVYGGLTGAISGTTGQFDVSYPISVDANFPTSVTDGQTVTIDTSSWTASDASLSLTGPGIGANFDLSLGGSLSLAVSGIASISDSLPVDINLSPSAEFKDNYGSITVSDPSSFSATSNATASTTGSLPQLSASGQGADFLTASLNLANLAATIAGWPALSGKISVPIIGDLDYNIMTAAIQGGLALAQDLTFTPLGVSVTMSYGGQSETKPLGQSFTFVAPSSGSGAMNVSAAYTLQGTVQTTTGIVGSLDLSLSAIQASGLGLSVGPLISLAIPDQPWTTGLQSWNSVTNTFSDSLTASDDYLINYGPSSPGSGGNGGGPPNGGTPPGGGPGSGSQGEPGVTVVATVNEPIDTDFLLAPFLSIALPSTGVSVSIVNFLNTKTGPGQLSFSGTPEVGDLAVAYSNIGQVGFSTGSTTGSDVVEIDASYSDGTTSNVTDLSINIEASTPPPLPPPQNSSGPVLGGSAQPFHITDGRSEELSSTYLSATDAAYPDPSEVTYNITSQPTVGTILRNGQWTHSFTQADIDAGLVTYQAPFQPNQAATVPDTFSYIVSDPSFRDSSSATLDIDIDPLPPPPAGSEPYIDISVVPAVSEGGGEFILATDLHVTDPNPNFPSDFSTDERDQAITYTIVQGPSHGALVWDTAYPSLWFGGASMYGQPVTRFTQIDLDNGWFMYKNDFTSGASDVFSFTVSDGFGGSIGLTTVEIPVEPRSPLELGINAGIFVTPKGQTVLLPQWLFVQDFAPDAFFPTITVVSPPSHGTILVSGEPATAFTQLDVDRGLVSYITAVRSKSE